MSIDKVEIARRHGIPEQADKLVGETKAELEADAAARAAIAAMFGKPATTPDEPTAPLLTDMSDEQLIDRSQAIEAERARRAQQAEAEAFGRALVRSSTKPSHQTLIDAPHGGDDDE